MFRSFKEPRLSNREALRIKQTLEGTNEAFAQAGKGTKKKGGETGQANPGETPEY